MRKTFLTLIVISGLIFASGSIAALVKLVRETKATENRQVVTKPADVSLSTVLQAHGVTKDKPRSAFTQNATLTYYDDTPTGLKVVMVIKLKLSTDGPSTRLDKTASNKTWSFLFDGRTVVQTTSEAGTQLGTRILDHVAAAHIQFQLDSCGLLPVLKHLSNPSTQVVYAGATSKGKQFQLKTASGPRYFYVNSNNLIDRFERDDITITYGDYRTVDGLNLPYHQEVKKGDKLLYDIKFDAVDFNPVFPPDFFKSELL